VDGHDLMRRLRLRDEAARHEVYEAYRQRVFAALLRLYPFATVHHTDCIQDGLVDAFLDLFDRPENFDPARSRANDPLLAYLIGIARRRTIDHLRRLNPDALNHPDFARWPDKEQEVDINEHDPPDEPMVSGANPADSIARSLDDVIGDLAEGKIGTTEFVEHVLLHVDLDTVLAALDGLTTLQKEVLLLKYLAELTTKEIMQLLDLSEDAVENTLRRARDVLRGIRRQS
jgi:RNA polymerase sigma factor (sigma-70 family)